MSSNGAKNKFLVPDLNLAQEVVKLAPNVGKYVDVYQLYGYLTSGYDYVVEARPKFNLGSLIKNTDSAYEALVMLDKDFGQNKNILRYLFREFSEIPAGDVDHQTAATVYQLFSQDCLETNFLDDLNHWVDACQEFFEYRFNSIQPFKEIINNFKISDQALKRCFDEIDENDPIKKDHKVNFSILLKEEDFELIGNMHDAVVTAMFADKVDIHPTVIFELTTNGYKTERSLNQFYRMMMFEEVQFCFKKDIIDPTEIIKNIQIRLWRERQLLNKTAVLGLTESPDLNQNRIEQIFFQQRAAFGLPINKTTFESWQA